jgi:hypothetical protein
MPVAENKFSATSLWEPSSHNWMAPGAVRSTAASFGSGLDLGSLRVQGGIWEILWTRTPSKADQRSSEWIPFEPTKREHLTAANAFRRYGPGWSYGPGHNMHSEASGYFLEVYGRKPTQMEQLDIEHNRALWKALEKAYREKIGFNPGTPPEPPVPPVPPVVVPVPAVVEPPAPAPAELTLTLDGKTRRFREIF